MLLHVVFVNYRHNKCLCFARSYGLMDGLDVVIGVVKKTTEAVLFSVIGDYSLAVQASSDDVLRKDLDTSHQ